MGMRNPTSTISEPPVPVGTVPVLYGTLYRILYRSYTLGLG